MVVRVAEKRNWALVGRSGRYRCSLEQVASEHRSEGRSCHGRSVSTSRVAVLSFLLGECLTVEGLQRMADHASVQSLSCIDSATP